MTILNDSTLHQLETEGYVVVEDLLDPDLDLRPVEEEYSLLLDELATQLRDRGELETLHRSLPFGPRLVKIMTEGGQQFAQHFDISLPQAGVTDETPMHHGRAVFDLLRSPRLLDAIEFFLGPEIYSSPVQHTRIKIPERLVPAEQRNALTSIVYWHNDNGVVLEEADRSTILTVWLPITDATEENGCLEIIPGSHRKDLPPHCPDPVKGVHIPPQYLPGKHRVAVPMKRGSVLFMNQMTVHSSLPNRSNDIRWSFDLRYNPIGQPTGRPVFPGFIARSRKSPRSVLSDPEEWAQLWRDARHQIAAGKDPVYNRWSADAPACA